MMHGGCSVRGEESQGNWAAMNIAVADEAEHSRHIRMDNADLAALISP